MDETRRKLRALYGNERDIAIAFAKKLDEPLRPLVQGADEYFNSRP